MNHKPNRGLAIFMAALAISALAATSPSEIKGSLSVGGVDAKLAHVRAKSVALDDKGTAGYAVLFSARPAEGNIESWKTADPKERGNFLYVVLTPKGEIWVYELGHTAAKNTHFGGVTEIEKVALEVKNGQISGRVRTNGEQSFSGDKFTVDLTFRAPVEAK